MPKDLCEIISNKKISEQEKIQVIKAALKEGADVSEPNKNRDYPLHLAFDSRERYIIKFLLEQGANFSIEYVHQEQPIHKAIVEGWLDILKILFERKLYLFGWYSEEAHAQCDNEMLPYQYISDCLYLINCELTPLSIAIQHGKAEIVEFILKHEPIIQQDFNKLGLKIAPFCEQKYTRYLRKGENKSDPIKTYEVYPIHLLAFYSSECYQSLNFNDWSKTLKILLKHGYDINQLTPDKNQESLLHLLCKIPEEWDTHETMKSAIKQGADPYQKNNKGKTPLITCYRYFDELTYFLCKKGYDLNRVWRPKSAAPKGLNFETILHYFPQHYVNVCHKKKISETNLGGIINRNISENTFKRFTKIESYRLAFKVSFLEDEKDNYYLKNLKKRSITNIEQLKTLDISQAEWTNYLRVLAAYLITDPTHVDNDLRNLLAEAFIVVIDTMSAKKLFEATHLSALKVVLENSTYVPEDIISSITDYYFKLYQKLFTQFPSLKLLASDALLTQAHELAEDTEIASSQMGVIMNTFESTAIKTIKAENGFHRLSFFCAKTISASSEEDSYDSLSNSNNISSSCASSKRPFSKVEDGGSEESLPKRYKI